jgi:hypothetical protein
LLPAPLKPVPPRYRLSRDPAACPSPFTISPEKLASLASKSAPAGHFLFLAGRLDNRKFDAAAVKVPDEDPRSLAAKRGAMSKGVGDVQGAHLSRLAAQQLIA